MKLNLGSVRSSIWDVPPSEAGDASSPDLIDVFQKRYSDGVEFANALSLHCALEAGVKRNLPVVLCHSLPSHRIDYAHAFSVMEVETAFASLPNANDPFLRELIEWFERAYSNLRRHSDAIYVYDFSRRPPDGKWYFAYRGRNS